MSADTTRPVGWLQAAELALDEAPPPHDGYRLAIVGPVGIHELCQRNWISNDCGKIIYNAGYCAPDTEALRQAKAIDATIVAWGDAGDLAEAAQDFVELRDHCSTALTGLPLGRVLIDSTALSKSLQLALLGMLVRTRAVHGIDLLYRQIEYRFDGTTLEEVYATDATRHKINDISFSIMGVPYVEGKYHSDRRRHVVLLAGLDYQRILSKVRELEPAALDVIIEREAVHERRSAELFETLCDRLDVGPENIAILSRKAFLDQIKAVRAAVVRARKNDLQPFIVAAGGKPAALAAAIQSVVESEAPVLISIPDRVVHLSQNPHGPFQLFRLDDPTGIV